MHHLYFIYLEVLTEATSQESKDIQTGNEVKLSPLQGHDDT